MASLILCGVSAVIEHVTVDKNDLLNFGSASDFHRLARERQRKFASEIRRVGKRYFVHTANKYFPSRGVHGCPCPSYSCLPWLIRLIRFQNKWWPKKDGYDWCLLAKRDMQHVP